MGNVTLENAGHEKAIMNYLSLENTDREIAVLTIDVPGVAVNSVSSRLLDEVATVLDSIEKDPAIKGLVIISGKTDNFVVGADLDEVRTLKDRESARAYIGKGNACLNRIEDLAVPVVCAIHGHCLGGGLEIPLVCDYRMASDSTGTVLGLPEVKVGLFPAGGGTQRLPRLIGIQEALSVMLTGKQIRAKQAKKIGLVDELVSPHGIKEAAIARALTLAGNGKKAPKKTSFIGSLYNRTFFKKYVPYDKLPDPTNMADLQRFALESNPVGRKILFDQARKRVMKQTQGLYPAPLAIIDSVEYGFTHGVRTGIEADIDRFAELAITPEAEAFVNLFFAMNGRKKNPMADKAAPVNKLVVLGAGLMGHGIAGTSLAACDTVLLKDISVEACANGMREIYKGLDKRFKSGALNRFEHDAMYGKLVTAVDYSRLAGTDLVIEAAFEDLDLKRKILAEVEAATDAHTIFASNTSSLPISEIARYAVRPENVIGMHYFSPVHSMPLLEIITAEKTSERALASALDFGIRQGKTCIVVKDGPAFYTTRILHVMLNEVMLMVEEGVDVKAIDTAMKRFGYPVGPVQLIDEVGFDLGFHVVEAMGKAFSDRGFVPSGGFRRLHDAGYLGKKNGKGFYDYSAKKKAGGRPVNATALKILRVSGKSGMKEDEIRHRAGLMMVNEAIRCLEEHIIASPEDGDLGAVLGLRFPATTGGPFRYVDRTGADKVHGILEQLRAKYGDRFTPAALLTDTAKRHLTFY